jgi:hypothetical protein
MFTFGGEGFKGITFFLGESHNIFSHYILYCTYDIINLRHFRIDMTLGGTG